MWEETWAPRDTGRIFNSRQREGWRCLCEAAVLNHFIFAATVSPCVCGERGEGVEGREMEEGRCLFVIWAFPVCLFSPFPPPSFPPPSFSPPPCIFLITFSTSVFLSAIFWPKTPLLFFSHFETDVFKGHVVGHVGLESASSDLHWPVVLASLRLLSAAARLLSAGWMRLSQALRFVQRLFWNGLQPVVLVQFHL